MIVTIALSNVCYSGRNCLSEKLIFSYIVIYLYTLYLHISRYNIPELAKKHKVYALDLLGFGWSDKALVDYDAMVWRDQVVDFMKEVVKEPAVLVGNR